MRYQRRWCGAPAEVGWPLRLSIQLAKRTIDLFTRSTGVVTFIQITVPLSRITAPLLNDGSFFRDAGQRLSQTSWSSCSLPVMASIVIAGFVPATAISTVPRRTAGRAWRGHDHPQSPIQPMTASSLISSVTAFRVAAVLTRQSMTATLNLACSTTSAHRTHRTDGPAHRDRIDVVGADRGVVIRAVADRIVIGQFQLQAPLPPPVLLQRRG